MSELDFGIYKQDYSQTTKHKKNYENSEIPDDSPFQLYQAEKQGKTVYLKVINKEALKEEGDYDFYIEHIQKEKEIHKLCNSNYILKLNRVFETEKNIVFEKEFCELDLKEYVKEYGRLEKNHIGKNELDKFKEIAIGIAEALKFIKEKGIVHRNIKPSNIYLNKNDKKVKLDDFSCAIYINEINDSEPMGTILYTAPEIIKNFDYDEKCDMWSVGLTLYEIYFGVLPFGKNANTKTINDIIYDEKSFKLRKSNIPTLDTLFKCLLEIDPAKRMTHSEFYNYVTNENFLIKDYIALDINEKIMTYIQIHEDILQEEQVEYNLDEIIQEKFNEEEEEEQNMEKILEIVEEGNLPDIMCYPNASVNSEEKFNNIIYYDSNIEKHKSNIYEDSDIFERETPGAFILCTNLESLNILKEEILKYRKVDKKVIFNIISNGRGFKEDLLNYLNQNQDFRKFINKVCIFCLKPEKYLELKLENPELIDIIAEKRKDVFNFIKKYSSKDIKPYPLTKLVRLNDYLDKYNERHEKISEFYGNLNPIEFKKNLNKIKEVINKDENENLLRKKKDKILEGLLTFDLEKDLKALDELIIKEYTKNTFYGDLNRWLMKGKMKYYEPVAYFTSRLMYSLNNYATKKEKFCNYEKELHRGAKLYYSCLLPYKRAVGEKILLSAFTSTSESDEVAKKWAGRGNEETIYKNTSRFSVVFHIKNIYPSNDWIPNVINIQKDSQYKKEKEFLFQPFSFYKVTEVVIDEKKYSAEIFLETIGKIDILEEKIKIGKKVNYNENKNIMEAI